MRIQGRMRKRALSMTFGRFFSRSAGVQPMKRSRGASLRAAAIHPKPPLSNEKVRVKLVL